MFNVWLGLSQEIPKAAEIEGVLLHEDFESFDLRLIMDDFDEIGVLNMVDLGIALFDEVLNLPNGAMDDELNSQRGFG